MTKQINAPKSVNPQPSVHPGSRILVFAREPLLGEVKSRLAEKLGAAEALAIYESMLARVGLLLMSAGGIEWDLWVTSNPSHKSFLSICNKRNIFLQRGVDLGARMHNAIQHTLCEGGREKVILIGTDCPAMTEAYLRQALTALDTGVDVVLGPAEDGGYVLVGMSRPLSVVFEAIPWGGDKVLERTLATLRNNQLSYSLLDVLWDVDRPEDLSRTSLLEPPLRW